MFELGKRQVLVIDHKADFGVYLCDHVRERGEDTECILLPKKQVPKGANIGDEIEVFVYKDSSDRLIATTKTPMLTIGEVKELEVVQVNKVGAFLYWGLEKDLLVPFSEQTIKVKKGEKYLFALYIDKSERLCGTMKVYEYLRTDSEYKENDMVSGTVFSVNPQYGAFVAIDSKYLGLIPANEMVRNFHIGEVIEARVKERREDGKLNLSVREKGYMQMDIDSGFIMEKLEVNQGFLPYHDKSSPADIKEVFGMSKNEYKRAIGRLYKMKKIRITPEGIYKL
ncbi:MAG: S1-like domain-containing RNA-binding protein [Eubacteriales bacterium]|nr:S1-like domain-containing RNA-binding protein [Eubacteriales bacterium]